MRILTKWLGKSQKKRIDDNPQMRVTTSCFDPWYPTLSRHFWTSTMSGISPLKPPFFGDGQLPCLTTAQYDQPSLRLGLPNHRRDAIGLHGSLEQGVQSMAGRNSAWKHRPVVSLYPHLVVPRRFLVQSSWIPMSVNSPISVAQIMSNLSSYACSQTTPPCFPKKVPKLTLKSPHHADAKQ